MENKPLEELNSDELSVLMDEKDKLKLTQIDMLDYLQVQKHNQEVELMKVTEGIRQCKKLISKLNIEHDLVERMFWRSKGK